MYYSKKNLFSGEKWGIKNDLREHLSELKTARGKQKAKEKAKKLLEELEQRRQATLNLPPVSKIEILVERNRSSAWGLNPTAHCKIWAQNHFEYQYASASGCGYDKLSTAVATALNQSDIVRGTFAKRVRKLNALVAEGKEPYGLRDSFTLMGGTGISCYERIFKALGYKWQHYESKYSDTIIIFK